MTTIKVDSTVRDRLNRIARDEGVSVSRALEGLVAERERAERFRRLRGDLAAMSEDEHEEYVAELSAWESLTDWPAPDAAPTE